MPRYVILHHLLSDGSHWDLMIEHADRLATWQLLEDPAVLQPGGGQSQVPARRIADHRQAYLSFEGPLSGQRGRVQRVDEGEADMLIQEPRNWMARFTGRHLNGIYTLPGDDAPGVLRWLGRETDSATEAAAQS